MGFVVNVMFDSATDRADIERMVAAKAVDQHAVREAMAIVVSPDDERYLRLAESEGLASR